MIESIILFIVIVVVSIGFLVYLRKEISSVKRYVKKELKQLVELINDAKQKEFNFDKQNEQNIRKLEKQLFEVSATLDNLTNIG